MLKLDLEKAEEPDIKLPTSAGSWKKQESPRKTSTFASLTMLKPLTVWITINCGNFFKRWKYDHLTCLLRNLYAGQEATVRTGKGQFSFQFQKENAKECSNYHTTALISHTSKVMLKTFQERLQQYAN